MGVRALCCDDSRSHASLVHGTGIHRGRVGLSTFSSITRGRRARTSNSYKDTSIRTHADNTESRQRQKAPTTTASTRVGKVLGADCSRILLTTNASATAQAHDSTGYDHSWRVAGPSVTTGVVVSLHIRRFRFQLPNTLALASATRFGSSYPSQSSSALTCAVEVRREFGRS
jgi:hypothetical protein